LRSKMAATSKKKSKETFDSALGAGLKVLGSAREAKNRGACQVFTTGQFSRISGLSVKALRIYQDQGILVPSVVDRQNGYRHYDFANVERARIIVFLRQMMFSLEEIKEILSKASDDADTVSLLENQRAHLESKIREMKHTRRSIDQLIASEKEAKTLAARNINQIEEKTIPSLLIAGIRIKGKYADCGQAFAKLARQIGRHISGKPINLFYDSEYNKEEADFESCVPVKNTKNIPGVEFKTLPGGQAVSVVHSGAYAQLGQSYAKVFSYVNERGYKALSPSREIYIKGPGIIFKGNPERYLTEIQFLVAK